VSKNRIEAFSDGVLAIVITIMVLELRVPERAERLGDLRPLVPVFSSYVLSFVFLGIYWNNHHHLLHATQRASAAVMWANHHLLFWLSLVPFTTAWMGENHFAPVPLALYGFVLLMAAVAYTVLQRAVLRQHGEHSHLERSLGRDRKGRVSIALYLLAIPGAFVSPWLAGASYVAVALMWLVPDRRIERALEPRDGRGSGA